MLNEKTLCEGLAVTRKHYPELYEKWLDENQDRLLSLLVNCIANTAFAPQVEKEEWNFGEAIDKVFESDI